MNYYRGRLNWACAEQEDELLRTEGAHGADKTTMDISALPNTNDPERFLQLDVGMLPATHGMFQLQAVMSSQRHWHNRVYNQMEEQHLRSEGQSPVPSPENSPVVFVDRYLEKHITPVTLKNTIKTNPLYMDFTEMEQVDNEKNKPSWTVQEYDTQTVHGNLAAYLKEGEKTPRDLDFWLEELYTPGFDSLLKKKEAEELQKKICKYLCLTLLLVCVILVVILVPILVLKKPN